MGCLEISMMAHEDFKTHVNLHITCQKKSIKRRKRKSLKRNCKYNDIEQKLFMIGVNAAGLFNKTESLMPNAFRLTVQVRRCPCTRDKSFEKK